MKVSFFLPLLILLFYYLFFHLIKKNVLVLLSLPTLYTININRLTPLFFSLIYTNPLPFSTFSPSTIFLSRSPSPSRLIHIHVSVCCMSASRGLILGSPTRSSCLPLLESKTCMRNDQWPPHIPPRHQCQLNIVHVVEVSPYHFRAQ